MLALSLQYTIIAAGMVAMAKRPGAIEIRNGPEMKRALQEDRKELFYRYGETCAQTIQEQDQH